MPSQQGYFDTLKSVAGKVFTYLASITLTGTDGKTITCTQDTSLDEAVAMSSKAPKTATIAGDGTAGRVAKSIVLKIEDGTAADTIKCTIESQFNGDVIGATDNVAKGATTGSFTLNAGGTLLKVEAAGLTGNVIGILSASIIYNDSALDISPYVTVVANDIQLNAYVLGVLVDLTTIVVGKQIQVCIGYITSA